MINLYELGKRYRPDTTRRGVDPWLMTLSGRHGHIYVHDVNQLAFAAPPERAREIVDDVPGCRVLQRDVDAWNVAFPTEALQSVGDAVGLRKRRARSEAQKSA